MPTQNTIGPLFSQDLNMQIQPTADEKYLGKKFQKFSERKT